MEDLIQAAPIKAPFIAVVQTVLFGHTPFCKRIGLVLEALRLVGGNTDIFNDRVTLPQFFQIGVHHTGFEDARTPAIARACPAHAAVLRQDRIFSFRRVVFIGMNTIITRNVEIGNNVIIGAGSVVTSSCDHNGVYAGVPAKRIMTIDEYYEKRERAQFNEAKELAVEYFDRYGKRPGKEVFHEYFMLFETTEEAQKNDVFRNKIALCKNELDTVEYMRAHKAMFSSYDEFIEKCFEKCTNCVKEQSE